MIERKQDHRAEQAGSSCPQMGNDRPQPSGGIEDTDQAELCALIFDNVEASVDYIGKGKATPIAVLSDVMMAADAILAAGYRRLSASPPPPEVQPVWRDISSAPKDGKPILLGHSQAVFDGYWDDAVAGWVRGDRDSYDELITYPATHWQPLPAIPDAGSGGIAATEPQALYEPIPSDEIRERVARIIDPVAWENRETHLRIANGPHTILARTTARRNADASVESSFAKADQILALYTTPGDTNG